MSSTQGDSGRGSDLALSYGLVVPIVLGAVAAFAAGPQYSFLAQNFTPLYAGAVVLFLAGVIRGVSARSGLALPFMAVGLATLFCVVWGYPRAAALIPVLGFAGIAILASRSLRAVRFGIAPAAIAILALLALAARAGGYV